MELLTPSFTAKLTFYTSEQGGRETPALSGYRPHIKFPFSDYLTSGQQIFLNKNEVYPGETVTARITILARDVFRNCLYEKLSFKFAEGPRSVGEGIVIEILDQTLLKII